MNILNKAIEILYSNKHPNWSDKDSKIDFVFEEELNVKVDADKVSGINNKYKFIDISVEGLYSIENKKSFSVVFGGSNGIGSNEKKIEALAEKFINAKICNPNHKNVLIVSKNMDENMKRYFKISTFTNGPETLNKLTKKIKGIINKKFDKHHEISLDILIISNSVIVQKTGIWKS